MQPTPKRWTCQTCGHSKDAHALSAVGGKCYVASCWCTQLRLPEQPTVVLELLRVVFWTAVGSMLLWLCSA